MDGRAKGNAVGAVGCLEGRAEGVFVKANMRVPSSTVNMLSIERPMSAESTGNPDSK